MGAAASGIDRFFAFSGAPPAMGRPWVEARETEFTTRRLGSGVGELSFGILPCEAAWLAELV
jgi:hypothetical protein